MKLRMLYLSKAVIPSRTANSIQIMKMCEAFSNLGIDVELIIPKNKDKHLLEEVDNVFRFYGVETCFNIKQLLWLPVKGRVYLYALISSLKAVGKIYEIIYGRCLESCFLCSLLGLNVVYEAHQPVKQLGKISEMLFKAMIKRKNFKKLIVISNKLRDYYISTYSISKSVVHVAHDGANAPMHNNSNIILKLDSTSFNIGYAGQLYPGKGMEIISKLVMRYQCAVFHIIGGMEKDIVYWKEKLNPYKNVIFYGFIEHNKVSSHLTNFDVLLAPYLSSVSGHKGGNLADWMSPLKIFEYMSLRKPIISSDLSVLREVLKHKENALLCEPDDVDCWINSLNLLRDDISMRDKLADNAFNDFTKHYTWNARADSIINAIIPNGT